MSTSPVHPAFSYQEVKRKLGSFNPHRPEHFVVALNTKLCKSLDKSVSIPWAVSKVSHKDLLDWKITVIGEEAGTVGAPNVDLLISKSQPSSFGRGDQTVFDPSYRSGRDIVAADMTLGDHNLGAQVSSEDKWDSASGSLSSVAENLWWTTSDSLPRRPELRLELYKLAIYQDGGHFDWHRDSTHGNNHHATLLVALNTDWKGGDLKLRHNGIEMTTDMHPTSKGDISAVCFYTDVEHMVEPVTEGVRLVLQYDVYLNQKEKDNAPEGGEEQEQDDDDDDDDRLREKQAGPKRNTVSLTGDAATLGKRLVEIISELHTKDGVHEVGFPLQHLYRKASIRPEYLKGIDAVYWQQLSPVFDVSLHPIVVGYESEECSKEYFAVKYDVNAEASGYEYKWSDDEESDDEGSDEFSSAGRRAKRQKVQNVFHLPKTCAVMELSSKEYVEYVGNESQAGEGKYFGGGIFVRAKGS